MYMSVNSTSSTSGANMLRITGMASGIDTDATVKAMVSSYQLKVDKESQAKQTLQWKQEVYRDIIKDIKGLQDYFDTLSSKFILSEKSFNTNSASSANSSIFSGTPSSNAKTGNYKVKVTQLAEQAKIEGSPKNSIIKVTDNANWNGKTIDFGAKGKIDLEAVADSNTSGSLTDEIVANINKQVSDNSQLKGKISASYVNDGTNEYIKFTNLSTDSITINKYVAVPASITTATEITEDIPINSGISSTSKLTELGFASGNTINFDLNYGSTTKNVSLTVGDSSTLQNLVDQVNSATGGSVILNIDDVTGKLSFQSKDYGSSSGLTITDKNSNIDKLGFTSGSTGIGKDALVEITAPGETTATTTTQSSNEFTSNGITYSLLGKGESTLTVSSNTDTVVSNMKKFIEDYNSVISTIQTKLTEKKNSDYAPLTDAQKQSMSDDQIKAWEAKAKVGILKNDGYLQNLMTQFRGTFFSPVYTSYDKTNVDVGKISLSFGSYGAGAIGIETSSDYTDGGKIVLKDETKLKDAIENNIEDFKKLFIGDSESDLETNESYIGSKKYNEDGIFRRIDTIMRDYVASPGVGKDGTYSLSGSMNIFVNKQYDFSLSGISSKNTLPDQIYRKLLNVSDLQDKLSTAETRYYNQFAQLEKAMNAMNSQMSYLSSQLGTSG